MLFDSGDARESTTIPEFSDNLSPPASSNCWRFCALHAEWESQIRICARSYAAFGCDIDDLCQAGRIALWKSDRAYSHLSADEQERCYRRCIANAMRNVVRDDSRHTQNRADTSDTSIEDRIYLGETHIDVRVHQFSVDPFESLDHDERATNVRAWVASLPASLKDVFRLIYVEGLSQRPAASSLNMSQARLAQLHQALKVKARNELACLL